MNSIEQLRKNAVKHILRQGPADFLLRQALCKPWISSTHENEMAWTDHKKLFFNFPKLNAALDQYTITTKNIIDPGGVTNSFLAALCHEIMHVLLLHKYRAVDKKQHLWSMACEYAINYQLCTVFSKDWIAYLGVMYPPDDILSEMYGRKLPFTTDGFYELFMSDAQYSDQLPDIPCKFCERNSEVAKHIDSKELMRVLNHLPGEFIERDEVVKFISSNLNQPQKVPWEMLLLGGLEDAVNQEQTWMRPSRKNDLLPGWRQEKLLNFVWILDVSPSIEQHMKESFMKTLQAGINLYHDSQHRVIFFGSGIIEDIMISSGTDLSQMEIPQSSGTCLEEVWEVLERDLPEFALVLSDLEVDAVPKPSFTKVVWGIVGHYQHFFPDYGQSIKLK